MHNKINSSRYRKNKVYSTRHKSKRRKSTVKSKCRKSNVKSKRRKSNVSRYKKKSSTLRVTLSVDELQSKTKALISEIQDISLHPAASDKTQESNSPRLFSDLDTFGEILISNYLLTNFKYQNPSLYNLYELREHKKDSFGLLKNYISYISSRKYLSKNLKSVKQIILDYKPTHIYGILRSLNIYNFNEGFLDNFWHICNWNRPNMFTKVQYIQIVEEEKNLLRLVNEERNNKTFFTSTNLPNLTTLILTNNDIDSDEFIDSVKVLSHSLANLTGLTTLDLSDNNLTIGDDIGQLSPPDLGKLKNLTTLNLASNNLGWDRVGAFVPDLGKMENLTTLNLANNGLGEQGVRALAPALEKLKHLTELDLSRNDLRLDGVKTLSTFLHQLKKLTFLDVSFNNLREDEDVENKLKMKIRNIVGKYAIINFRDFHDFCRHERLAPRH